MKKLISLFFLLWSSVASANTFAELQFGKAQFSDTQWNVSACLYTSTCQIYSLSGIGTTWNTGSPYTLTTGQYIRFSPSGNSTYPWTMKVYNSNGTLAATLGNGRLTVQGLGTDSSGHHFFFFVNANYNGTVFSTDYGFPNSNGFSFTGTSNPTVAQTDSFASTGSTAPLAAGETFSGGGGSTTPTYPAATISSYQQNAINQTLSSHNLVYIDQSFGDHTYVKVTQTGDHDLFKATITGSYQSITSTQTGNYNYAETVLSGSNNTITNSQDGSKALFQTVTGSNNNITTSQTGGNHFLELNIPTNYNTVSVTQSGAAQKLFSLTINSPNVGVTVQQTNATTPDSAAMSITCNSGPCNGYSYTKN